MRKVNLVIGIVSIFGIVACGSPTANEGETASEETTMEEGDHMDHAEMTNAEGQELLPVPEGARVYFKNLQDGDAVKNPIKVEFGVEGMEVEPAGELNAEKGHHHLIIDGNYVKRGGVVPADSMNIHYGGGQTETEINLSPGEHYLTMQFADGFHQSYGEQMSAIVLIIVEE